VRILFTRFPLESALGGAEIQTLSLMEGLIEKGHAVAFAGSCPVLLKECRLRNIPFAEVHIGKPPVTKLGAVSFAWRKQLMKRKLKAMLDTFTIDVICMLSLSEKILLTEAASKKKIKTIWIEHDRVSNWLSKNPWLPALLKQSQRAVTVTVSELSRKIYLELGWDEKKTVAIPNGIDEKRFLITSQKLTANSQKLRIGCIARLSPEKGLDILIEAFAATPDTSTLEIIGTGKQRATLEKLVDEFYLHNRVTFTSKEKDIAAAYERFDVLVLPSTDNDPFGLVAAEAMTFGIPVIVTDQCGIAGYLEHEKDALIVKAGSIKELTEAINRMSNVESRMLIAKRSEKTARQKFSAKTMVENYEKVFARATR